MHKKYKIVHVHNPPDTLVFSAILLRVLFKTKIILNIHDPLPELLASRSGKSMSDPIVRLANAVEIIFARLSDSVITVNDVIKTDLKAKGIESSVVMNVLPLQRMEYPPKKSKSFVVVSVGHLLPHRDMETVIEGVKLARDNVPDVVLHVVGGGEMLDTLKRKVVAEGLHEIVFFYGETPHDTAMTEIANSDACVIPFGDTPINQIGTPYKLFEYIFCGKPVLAPRLRALKSLLKEDECYFFKPGNSKELAENIVRIHDNPSGAKETVRRAGRIVKEYNWDIMEKRLIECYKKLE
jgi:glycosyltransferase involved in cell wall biosynthesis